MIYESIKNNIINVVSDGISRSSIDNKYNFDAIHVAKMISNKGPSESLIFLYAKITLYIMRNNNHKEEFIMMNFILLTVSFTVAILLSGVISTVVMFKLMGNAKFAKWITNYYLKVIEKSVEGLEDDYFKEAAPN